MKKYIITSLPVRTNDGRDTSIERKQCLAELRANGCTVSIEPAMGLWYDDDGKLYQEKALHCTVYGSESVIRRALEHYGCATRQIAMLFVEETPSSNAHIVATGRKPSDAATLAKVYGGATLFSDGHSVVYDYHALDHGVDYQWSDEVTVER